MKKWIIRNVNSPPWTRWTQREIRAFSFVSFASIVVSDASNIGFFQTPFRPALTAALAAAPLATVAQPFGAAVTAAAAAAPLVEKTFALDAPAEVVATIRATCARCDWGIRGREAAAIAIGVDGQYRSHLLLTRGREEGDYRILLGHYGHGSHTITLVVDASKSAPDTGTVRVAGIDLAFVGEADPSYEAVAHAPVLYARPNTIGRFSDVPLLMWHETATTARGRSHRYSVVFSNEDGGTATDRLMATWGRTTDIEFVYGIELDATGRTLAEEFQGPEHVMTPFRGAHEARHPLEFVVTDNNMVSDTGTTTIRYAPAPELFDLKDRSREVVMDAHAWTYRVASQEMMRERKIADPAPPGSGRIPDPRRFVFVEACSDLENAALSFSVRSPGSRWYDSDRGRDEFRIVRTGCFRGAVPLPRAAATPDAIRFRAWVRPGDRGTPASVRITRVNRVFVLGDDFLPGPSRFSWTGSLVLKTDGTPSELLF
jgi:hypothetical protein